MSDRDVELSAAIVFRTEGTGSAANAAKTVKEEADKAASGMRKVGEEAAKTDREVKKPAGSAEKAFASINAATQVTQGGVAGLGQTIRNLGEQFPQLSSAALGPIGLILAAFAAWKKAVDAVRDAKAALLAGIRAIQQTNLENQIRRQTEAYEAQLKAIDDIADSRRRLNDINQAKDDAQMRAQLAALELEQAQAKAALAPDDAIGARKIDADYSARRAGLEESAASRRSEREATQIAAAVSDLLDRRNVINSNLGTMSAQFSQLSGRQNDLVSKAMSKQITWETADKEGGKLAADMQALGKQIRDALQQRADMDLPISELRAAREVNAIDRSTAGTRSRVRQANDDATRRSIALDENRAVDSAINDLNTYFTGAHVTVVEQLRAAIRSAEQKDQLTVDLIKSLAERFGAAEQRLRDQDARQSRL